MEPTGEIIVYRSYDGQSSVQLRAVGGTVWLTQAQMAELYDTSHTKYRADRRSGAR